MLTRVCVQYSVCTPNGNQLSSEQSRVTPKSKFPVNKAYTCIRLKRTITWFYLLMGTLCINL